MCGSSGGRATYAEEKHRRTVQVSRAGEARVLARCPMLGVLGRAWRPGWGGAVGRDPQEKMLGLWEDREPRTSQ